IIGLETALSLALMELVEPGVLSIKELILKMSVNPARLMGADKGGIKEGAQADIVIIDPAAEYVYKKDSIESKSKNSPFIGWKLKGKALFVFTGGALKVKNGTVMISEVHGNG
ncbi:MAG: amidohydrolase family protein, partial [Candidatus Omnitrophota bacterium]|nr:amidohydrolase family protein [Candidatus Omnitrophota bacterium]